MPEASEALSSDAIDEIRERGYTVIRDALGPAELRLLREELSPWLQGEFLGRNNFEGFKSERVYALLTKAPSTAMTVEHARVLPVVDAFLQPGYLLSAALAIKLHADETEQPFHIDDGGDTPLLGRPRAMVGVSTIWALDDFTEKNGATQVIPGSHLWDEDEQPLADKALTVTMPAGSVLVFAGNLFHRGGANRTQAARLALTVQYCMPWLRQIENMSLAVPAVAAKQYSKRVQEMLGYGIVSPGFMGYVDGKHPARLLDDDYLGRKRQGIPTHVPANKPIY
jgi:ectoine hydroxylase-related dioxygenase (phytanoyl-CoA dioxygenase family)